MSKVALAAADLDALPEETLDDIERKSADWDEARLDETRTREELCANLIVAAYFAKKTRDTAATAPRTEDLNRLRTGIPNRPGVGTAAGALAIQHCFFHWHLAFAEIMESGGFDVVLGNPPWERIKLQEQEFFALRSPEIASAPNKASRDRLIRLLARDDALPTEKALFEAFETAKREAEAISQFVRTGGRFPLTGVGDINTYAVFAETFLSLINPQGRAGLIVPTGIATDHSTKAFFNEVATKETLVSLYDFENREAVFSGVHRSYKFCLLTLTGTGRTSPQAEFAFFLHQTEQLGGVGASGSLYRLRISCYLIPIRGHAPSSVPGGTWRSPARCIVAQGCFGKTQLVHSWRLTHGGSRSRGCSTCLMTLTYFILWNS